MTLVEKWFTCPRCGDHGLLTVHAGDMERAMHSCKTWGCDFKVRGPGIEQHMSPVVIHDETKAD
jgi:transcription elongation factor Elf1